KRRSERGPSSSPGSASPRGEPLGASSVCARSSDGVSASAAGEGPLATGTWISLTEPLRGTCQPAYIANRMLTVPETVSSAATRPERISARSGSRASKRRLASQAEHERFEPVDRDRLDGVGAKPSRARERAIGLRAVTRERDERQRPERRLLAQPPRELVSIHHWKANVEDRHVG